MTEDLNPMYNAVQVARSEEQKLAPVREERAGAAMKSKARKAARSDVLAAQISRQSKKSKY